MSLLFLNEDAQYNQEVASVVDFAGEADELAQITEELQESFNSATISMARIESKYLVENATGALTEATTQLVEAGAVEWFKNAGEAIKAYFLKFVAWLKSVGARVMNFFTGADAFLRKNREKLTGLSDADLGKVKFDRIAAIADGNALKKLTDAVTHNAGNLISGANKESTQVKDPNKAILVALKGIGKGDSVSAIFKDGLMKVVKADTPMTKSDVKTMMDLLSAKSLVEGILKNGQQQAASAIKMAESVAAQGYKTNTKGATSETNEPAKKTLANLRNVSGVVSRLYAASLSISGSVFSHAKSGLSKAASAGGAPAAAAPAAKQEDGSESVLFQFGLN